jgi:hypothetical protein
MMIVELIAGGTSGKAISLIESGSHVLPVDKVHALGVAEPNPFTANEALH